jgi:tRNA (cmo5U34)-methyltransferase
MPDAPFSAPAIFEGHASEYDASRQRLIPAFEAFYGWAATALELADRPPRRVLDLGAGTGLLSARIAAAYPEAELTLLDGAPAMLAQARERLGPGIRTVVGDLRDPLPEGPFDAVISALAIHHLDGAGQRELLHRVHAALAPGGVFVNAEQVAAPTPRLEAHYLCWHEEHARAAGSDEAEWAAAIERMRADRCTDVESQLRWLREAGFPDADCLHKDGRFAVIAARRR